MSTSKNLWSNWFEIPVTDFVRAKTFFESIFQISIHESDFGNLKMGIFPHADNGCALVQGDHYIPSENGIVIYLNADPDLTEVLNRIEPAGGKILQHKKLISQEHGYMALFTDTEGNRLALWSHK